MGIFTSRGTSCGKLEQFCSELGFPISHRNGPAIGVPFKGDHLTQIRTVIAYNEPGTSTVQFRCTSRAEIPGDEMPATLFATLIGHNFEVPLGAWGASLGDTVTLGLNFSAFIDDMDAAQFSAICQLMVAEVAKIEAYLHRKGWL